MRQIFVLIFLVILKSGDSRIGKFLINADLSRENDFPRLNTIMKYCGEEKVIKELSFINISGKNLGEKFYENIYKDYIIPVQIYGDLNRFDFVGWQSCVILSIPNIFWMKNISEILSQYSWIPSNIYVLYVSDKIDILQNEEDKIWLKIGTDLWRKKSVHKFIISTKKRNLFFDPFAPNSDDENPENIIKRMKEEGAKSVEERKKSFGAIKELDKNSTELLKSRDKFDGYEANVALFPYVTVEKDDDDYFYGPDVEAMREIFKLMNISAKIFNPPDKFGWFSNGKFFGTLGRLVYHESDFAFNGFFVKNYGSEMLEFSTYLNTDKICVIVAKQPRIPEYLLILRIFNIHSWILIIAGNNLVALSYVSMSNVEFNAQMVYSKSVEKRNFTSSRRRKFTEFKRFLGIWIFLCSYPAKLNPDKFGQRLQVACGLMLSIVIGGAFTSQLASSFSKPGFLKNIDTLAELDESGLEILTSFPNLLNDVFADNESTTYRNLQEKLELKNASEIEIKVLYKKNAGYLDRLDAFMLDKNSNEKLHVVSEFPQEYPLAYPIVKGSPFLPRLNAIIGRFQNGGLYLKWFEDMRKPATIEDSQKPVIIRLPHLYIPFSILFAGLGIAGIIFFCELNNFFFSKSRGGQSPE